MGHWLDSLGHSILVAVKTGAPAAEANGNSSNGEAKPGVSFTAVLTPMVDHPNAKDRVLGGDGWEVEVGDGSHRWYRYNRRVN